MVLPDDLLVYFRPVEEIDRVRCVGGQKGLAVDLRVHEAEEGVETATGGKVGLVAVAEVPPGKEKDRNFYLFKYLFNSTSLGLLTWDFKVEKTTKLGKFVKGSFFIHV